MLHAGDVAISESHLDLWMLNEQVCRDELSEALGRPTPRHDAARRGRLDFDCAKCADCNLRIRE